MPAGPYGLGFGLGAAGAGAAQGQLQATLQAPQIKAENLMNQQREGAIQQQQMNISQQQAENQALSSQAPTMSPDSVLTPHDQEVANLHSALQNVPAGQGIVRQKVQAQLIDAAKKQHQFQLKGAIDSALAQQPDKAVQYLNAAGIPAQSMKLNPETNEYVIKTAHGDEIPLNARMMAWLSANPDQLEEASKSIMQNEFLMNRLGFQQQKATAELGEKQRVHDMQAQWHKYASDQGLIGKKAMAGAILGAAGIREAGAKYRFEQRPDIQFQKFALTRQDENGLGWNPKDVLDYTNAVQQLRHEEPEMDDLHVALGALKLANPGNMAIDSDTLLANAKAIQQFLPPRDSAQGPSPSVKPVRTPRGTPSGLPDGLKGAPKAVIDAYNGGKEVTDANGKSYKKGQ
jgi:hypothetical protein